MANLGFKQLLLLSIITLVAVSVAASSYISYSKQEATLVDLITKVNEDYVEKNASEIQNLLREKIGGLEQLGQHYENKAIIGSEQDFIEMTHIMAKAMNLNSAVVAFTNGDAYWNQTAKTWPNHKFDGDVTTRSWYQDGRNSPTASMTEPYLGSEGDVFWISMVRKTKSGMISADMQLGFLADLVKSANDIPGATAFIINHDTSILASSTSDVELSKKAADYPWLAPIANQMLGKSHLVQSGEMKGEETVFFSHQITIAGKNWYYLLTLDESVAYQQLSAAQNIAILTTLIATLISVVLVFFVLQLLYRPILALKETIDDLSQGNGDLTQRLNVTTNDDLGKISTGVNRFIESLQAMMLEIRGATEQLDSNIQKLRDNSQSNSTILQSHVSETEQIVTAIEEMNATAESMASDAANTAQLTQKAHQAGSDSRETVTQAQNNVNNLVADVENSADSVNEMAQQTESIHTVLSVIGDIAEQTNLLALNAAIEAARAGEQGRGFAVVADEVRKLASRTKDSTEEIEVALTQLLKGSQVVVHSMSSTKERCEETSEGAGKVSESLDTMTQFVTEINDLSTQIATAAEEQSSVTHELSRNMVSINEIVGQLDSNGQENLTEAERISEVNAQLSSIVSRFKL